MAENVIRIESPIIRGVYLHSIANVPGTVATQNFMSIFNPVGSGVTMTLAAAAFSYTNINPATDTTPLRGYRCSAASGGTLITASQIQRFNTLQPDPKIEVRVGNPTTTNAPFGLFNSPPPIDNRSSNVHELAIPPTQPFVCREGEGIVITKLSGVTSADWNITLVWAEL